MTAKPTAPPPLVGAAMLPPVPPGAAAPAPVRPAPAPSRPAAARARPAGRFAVVNGFVDQSMAGLTTAAVKVWLTLWRDTKPDGTARTGQADLARRAGVSDRAVRSAVTALTAAGLVLVVRKGRLGSGPSVYRVFGVGPTPPSSRKPASGRSRKSASRTYGSSVPPSQNGTRSGGPLARPPQHQKPSTTGGGGSGP